ncbi:Glucanosyltransferase-domain-containing protein [Tuber indicum]|nr:Glucanosyltransferase-domain-containing protein [Tuber indicum]
MKLQLSVLAAFLAGSASAVRPLTAKGGNFVNSAGDRFVIVGLAYQPGGASGYDPASGKDPLSDPDICLRDAAVMQRLGINTIRVYNVNPEVNHDMCMSIFNSVGIYVALDVNSPLAGDSIHRHEPESSYHEGYIKRIYSVVDAFRGYPNLLGFFAGNEVVNDALSASLVPPYIRAIHRDLKKYIAKHAPRTIPVGYSAADDPTRRPMWAYLSCGDDADSRTDFYGLNSYQWCGDSTWESSGYQGLVDTFKNTSVPLFFSEFGCNKIRPRPFGEIAALYGERMISSWSGGLVYEYSQEKSDYGIVQIDSNGDARLLKDFDNLQSQYNNINFNLIKTKSAATTTARHPKCEDTFILQGHSEKFNTSTTLPPNPATDLLEKGSGNTNVGKLVPVTQTKTPHKVFTSTGVQIDGIEIKMLKDDESNTPSGENTSSSTASSGSGGGSGGEKGAAGGLGVSAVLVVGVAVVVGFWGLA